MLRGELESREGRAAYLRHGPPAAVHRPLQRRGDAGERLSRAPVAAAQLEEQAMVVVQGGGAVGGEARHRPAAALAPLLLRRPLRQLSLKWV